MKKQKPVAADDGYERDETGHIIGEKPEERAKLGNHIGPRNEYGGGGWGYDLLPGGIYKLAPCVEDAYRNFQSETEAIYQLIDHVQITAMERLTVLAEQRTKWFMKTAAGVYRPDDWQRAVYNPQDNTMTFKEKERRRKGRSSRSET